MKIFEIIDKLIIHAKNKLGLCAEDVIYVRNSILTLLNLGEYEASGVVDGEWEIQSLLDELKEVGVNEGVFTLGEAPSLCDAIMGTLSLRPSEISAKFYEIYKKDGAQAATTYFYQYCVDNNYVKRAILDKNPRYDFPDIVVTINLAKPEFRDPKKAASGNSVAGGYPKCVICHENEGLSKRDKFTLRTIPIELNGEKWFWQFSPYGYFYQHGIAVNCEHIPMHVDADAYRNLLAFADMFPHYFIGSNAALERIGGSVLAHDHYQGGGEVLPLHRAKIGKHYKYKDYDDVEIGSLDWPNTAIRLVSSNKERIVELGTHLREVWVNYRNDALELIPEQNGKPCHEVSPTVVKRGDVYEMSIILRSNYTNEQYPDGIYHAHPEFHIIKKESIGLIEAQGLFILPGRLVDQLASIEAMIESGEALSPDFAEFELVYNETRALFESGKYENAHEAMKDELASICYRILQNTAVFKQQEHLDEFMSLAGFDVL